jgi:putative polyhydroxyalkanoate system protein
MRTEVAQHDAFGMGFEAGVAIGKRGVVDADVALGQAPDLARLVEGDAAAVMRAADAAQHHARIGTVLIRSWSGMFRFGRRRRRRLAEQQPFIAIHEDRISGAKHADAPYRTSVDMQPARAFAHLQPDTAAIDTELRDRLSRIVDDDRTIDEIAADGMHAWTKDEVRLLAIGKPQSQGSHVAVNMGRPQSSTPRVDCSRRHAARLDADASARTMRRIGGTTMPSIDIRHAHSLPHAKARKAVQEVADKLAERFGFDYDWDGDTLNFTRSGVDGKIDLAPKSLRVTANLGFLMSAFKGPIESEIKRVLDERFT